MGSIVSSILDPFTGASSTRSAAEQAAAQQAEAGRQAANIAAFRPVGMTSRFGTSRFGVTDVGGVPRVTSAEYEVAPELRAIQDRLMGLTGGALTTAEQAQAAGTSGSVARKMSSLLSYIKTNTNKKPII